jgi:hypothetical protein
MYINDLRYQRVKILQIVKINIILYFIDKTKKKKTKLRGLTPQANYTDRATAAVGEVVPTFADRGVLRGQRNGISLIGMIKYILVN